MSAHHSVRIGCAGEASDLERQAGIFTAIELDASFSKPWSRRDFDRWAAAVPAGFRFSVKLPRGLISRDEVLKRVEGLGEKLGTVVMPLPLNLPFHAPTSRASFANVWCIFDNNDRQGAFPNALEALRLLEESRNLSLAA
jgi:uncharacterized protein YecE (DUF72 family)